MINRSDVIDFFCALDGAVCRESDRGGKIFLVGETSQLIEGWQRWNSQIDFCAVVDSEVQDVFDSALSSVSSGKNVSADNEFPGDVVPLPEGYEGRVRPLTDLSWSRGLSLSIQHFDPYSVCYRYIMRGSETDYKLVLRFLEYSWVSETELDSRLEKLLPELTFETIQQDPAELRRRYSGLKQMWRARQVIQPE